MVPDQLPDMGAAFLLLSTLGGLCRRRVKPKKEGGLSDVFHTSLLFTVSKV